MELNSLILVKDEDYLLYSQKKAEAQELYKQILQKQQAASIPPEVIERADELLDIENMKHSQKILDQLNLALERTGDTFKIIPAKVPHSKNTKQKESKYTLETLQRTADSLHTTETPRVKKAQSNRSQSHPQLKLPILPKEELDKIDNLITAREGTRCKSSLSQNHIPKPQDSIQIRDCTTSRSSISLHTPAKQNKSKRGVEVYQDVNKHRRLSLNLASQCTYPSATCSDRTPHTARAPSQLPIDSSHMKLDKQVLSKYLQKVNTNLQDVELIGQISDTHRQVSSASTTHRKKSKKRHRYILTHNELKAKEGNSCTVFNIGKVSKRRCSEVVMKREENDKLKKTMNDDLLSYLTKWNPEILEGKAEALKKHKSLNNKLYKMMRQSPAELYRIISSPDKMNNKLQDELQQEVEWTEEKERAFKALSFKSHNYNSIAKTRLFKEAEKKLPKEMTVLDKEWKYDIHSPFVNDLDFQPSQNLKRSSSAIHKPISNLILKNAPKELTPEEQLIQHKKNLQYLTGETKQENMYILEKIKSHIDQIHEFRDKINGLNVIDSLKKGKKNIETARVKLSDYIVDESEVAKKILNKGRYAYLSSKVAHQRANIELYDKSMLKAERKRQKLRKRQEKFQREVIISRNIVNKLYGASYSGRKRSLETTAYPIGSPLFRKYMIQLGYLKEDLKPQPKHLTNPQSIPEKPFLNRVEHLSKANLSRWNFQDEDLKASRKAQNLAAAKVTAIIKGYIVRLRCKRMRAATIKIQQAFRVYRARKTFCKYLIYDQIIQGNYRYPYLMMKFINSAIFQRMIKDLRNKSSLDSSFQKMVERAARNASPGNDEKSPNRKAMKIHARLQKLGLLSPKASKKLDSFSAYARENQGKAVEINDLKQGILKNRAEMWKLYIAGIVGYCPSDEEIAHLMNPENELIKTIISTGEISESPLELIRFTTNEELLHQPILNKLHETLLSAQKTRNSIWRQYFHNKSIPNQGNFKETHGDFYILRRTIIPPIIPNSSYIQQIIKKLIEGCSESYPSPERTN